MRILQVASFYAPVIGGMETVLRDLATGLAAAGDEVTVLCAASGLAGADEMIDGVRVIRSPSLGKLLSQPLTPLLPVTLRRLRSGFDVVHLHMPNPLAESAVMTLGAGKPVVVTYHADVIRQRAFKPLYGPLRTAVLRKARRIVVPTENHIRHSEVLPAVADRCAIVPFGLSHDRYRLDEAAQLTAHRLREQHGRFALFVGRFVYYKGIVDLVESMRGVDHKLVVVGDGPLRQQVLSRVSALGLEHRVVLTGALPQAELNAYLEACALLVLPSISRSEGFGMTLLEGMMFGKPLITTRLPSGVQFVNDDGRTGFQVEPRDSAALADAMNRLLTDEGLSASMGGAARTRLETHFSYERMIAGYRDVYREALGG